MCVGFFFPRHGAKTFFFRARASVPENLCRTLTIPAGVPFCPSNACSQSPFLYHTFAHVCHVTELQTCKGVNNILSLLNLRDFGLCRASSTSSPFLVCMRARMRRMYAYFQFFSFARILIVNLACTRPVRPCTRKSKNSLPFSIICATNSTRTSTYMMYIGPKKQKFVGIGSLSFFFF